MSDEQPTVAGRRRTRGAAAEARAEALERLKALRSGGRRDLDFQVKVDQPIYDTVDEEEYEALVAKRREEVKGFIIDDDGLGYGDEGQEEDWSLAGVPLSSEESEGEPERPKRKKNSNNLEKKEREITKKPSALQSAAALMGRQRISNMFTSSVFKKNREDNKATNLSCDSIVDEVIAEFAPDENDREKRRRGNLNNLKNFVPVNLNDALVKLEKTVTGGVNSSVSDEIQEINFGGSQSLFHLERGESMMGKEKVMPRETEEGRTLCNESKEEGKENSECSDNKNQNEDSLLNRVEVKEESAVKEKEKVFSLNAKIEESKDLDLSATLGWQAVRSAGEIVIADEYGPNQSSSNEEKSDFEVDSKGSLPFYILDAHEEIYGANAGNLYLFGKVKAGDTYHSCCVVVKNMQRCVYAFPTVPFLHNDTIAKLERDIEDSRMSLKTFKETIKREKDGEQSRISSTDYKDTIAKLESDVEESQSTLCTRLHEMALAVKTEMAKQLVDRNVSSFSMAPVKRNYAFERTDIPHGKNYVLKINYPFKDPVLPSDLKGDHFYALLGTHSSALELFLVKRKIKGPSWLSISKFSSCPAPQRVRLLQLYMFYHLYQCTAHLSERALLNRLMIELHKLDSDVLVGHNISGFDLDVILHRVQACRVPSSMWSKVGRLKRSVMPKLNKGSSTFGSGASQGIISCIAGRLLCDTYICSRDLLKEVSYSLTQLAKSQLNKDRKEITPHDIPHMFQNSESLMELIEYGETDAWLSMELMFHLSVLPLTRQLTSISGNLWGKTLQGARAQRVEYLLLHAFHSKKFIVPDKFSTQSKEMKTTKRTLSNGVEGREIDDVDADDTNFNNEPSEIEHGKTKRGPSYAGGLVLEPKKGLYEKYILLLDFNSLYPSIIQEYNICFTTVERFADGSVPHLPCVKTTGVLPELLKNLVERRRMVKSWLKTASGLKVQQLDIHQQALKLTANSIYGCLGFSNSRFFAKPLAEIVTQQGREILQSTVDLVQNTLNLEVIYGDTDSIMIYSGLDDIVKAKSIAAKVIQEVGFECDIKKDGKVGRSYDPFPWKTEVNVKRQNMSSHIRV
ncbi:DNA polymerase alpha catalytic subunit-like [Olea europaea var. sylvestris]|uniref:DNA polymerase alpha catalytic subunit-like n=1 Tax=Olea europaea var. sylvestris TaxID=158386 RepID=UPI000C1D0F4E|nr:DNA polymerase alpha catalytic subunit-like [Olea europaea var. sylvestris]